LNLSKFFQAFERILKDYCLLNLEANHIPLRKLYLTLKKRNGMKKAFLLVLGLMLSYGDVCLLGYF